jgi:hypothetical protein
VQKCEVLRAAAAARDAHAPLDAPDQGTFFVQGKIMPGALSQKRKDHFQLGDLLLFFLRRVPDCGRVPEVGHQLFGHPGRGQHIVDQAGIDRAAGHSPMPRRDLILRHHHTALFLDLPNPQGAVASGAGQNDTAGRLAAIKRQGSQKNVDRHVQIGLVLPFCRRIVPPMMIGSRSEGGM